MSQTSHGLSSMVNEAILMSLPYHPWLSLLNGEVFVCLEIVAGFFWMFTQILHSIYKKVGDISTEVNKTILSHTDIIQLLQTYVYHINKLLVEVNMKYALIWQKKMQNKRILSPTFKKSCMNCFPCSTNCVYNNCINDVLWCMPLIFHVDSL